MIRLELIWQSPTKDHTDIESSGRLVSAFPTGARRCAYSSAGIFEEIAILLVWAERDEE